MNPPKAAAFCGRDGLRGVGQIEVVEVLAGVAVDRIAPVPGIREVLVPRSMTPAPGLSVSLNLDGAAAQGATVGGHRQVLN